MTARAVLLTLLGILGLGLAIQCPKQKTSPGREIVCYTSTNDIASLTESICRCTTLVHQGHDVRNISTSDFEDFRKSLKEVNPPMQFVLQVDDPARTIKNSATIRRETTARLVRLLKEVDGVELNVTAGTKDRLFQFVKGVRDEMVKKSLDKRLFLALPTRAETLAKQFNLKDLTKYVDLFTVATHYLVDEDEAYNTFHPSRLMGLFDMINTDSLIDLISGLGAPKRKILVSVPASAYRFTLKDQSENAPRSPTNEKEPVIIDRKELCDSMNQGEWTIERDEDLTAPYAFKNKTWVAFEDPISVGIKGKYALLRELPGLAVHNVENDYKTDCGKPVTHEIYHSFTDFKRKSRAAVLNALEDDLHQSQITYPNQVKSSNFRVVRVVDTEGHIRVVRENTQTEFTCSNQGYFVHPRSCNRFYRCVKFNQEVENYSVFEFDCPAGLAFDERTEVCVWPGSLPEGSPCPGSSEIAPVARVRFECPSQPGYYPDPNNARWFFACIDLGGPELMAYEFRCPYGLVFDGEKLVCEWPWLVRGYSGTEYTKTEYDYRGFGGSSSSHGAGGYGSTVSSQGTGGYVTGGIPHGFYPADTKSGSGGYDQHSGAGVAGGQSGYGSTSSQGHSFGHDYSGTGSTGFTGTTVGSHGGSDATVYTGHGYAGSDGQSYDGSYSGSSGTQHSGSSGHGYSGSAGTQYSGSAGHDYSGTTGTQYSGSAGHDYSGTTGTQYLGSAGHDYSGTSGTQYSGSAGHDYSGTTGTQYSGSAGHDYSGTTGTQYSGSAGHDYSGTTGSQHSGSAGHDYSGTAGSQHSGSAGHDYSGTAGTQYSGSAGHDYSGTTGTQYSGSAGHDYSGTTGTQYSGSAGHDYSGSTGTQHSGSAGHASSGTTGTQYSGSAGHGYSGSTAGGSYGSNGFDYSQSTDTKTGSGISTSDSGSYSGSSGSNGYAGSSGASHGVSGTIDYSGGSLGTDYSDVAGVGNVGSFEQGSVHGGSQGTKYSGSTTTVHAGGSYGTSYSQSGAAGSSSTSGHFGGGFSTGGGYAGAAGAGSPQHGYSASSGTTGFSAGDYSGSGYSGTRTTYVGSVGVSDSHGQTPAVTLVGHGQGIPSVTYLPSTPSAAGHGFPGQSGVTTTYYEGVTGSDGYSIKGSNIGGGKGTIVGSTVYHGAGGIGPSYEVPVGGSNVNITLLGQRPVGGTPYHGYDIGKGVVGTGTIISGNTIQGTIITDDSSSGTVFTHGDASGAVFTGSSDQGSIVTGSSYPGYANTGAGTPGYVISGGVKTVYPGSASPGAFIHGSVSPGITLTGPSVPGTILKGDASPGIVLTGQAAPGVLLGGSVEQGTIVGSTASHHFSDTGYTSYQSSTGGSRTDSTSYTGTSRTGSIPTSPDTGYKTNEYHDNGGRGTIKFNNGFVTTKYTENDIPDYRPAGPTITDSVLTGGVISSSASVTGSPVPTQRPGYSTQRPLTPSGFTKTGPTKTGITTAALGGRGTYVISNGQPKPILNPEHIGAKAFEGNVAGYTRTSTESSNSDRSYSSSTAQSHDTSYVDTSKITLGPSVSNGYSYPKPSIPFVTGGATSTPYPVTSTDAAGIIGVTTPTPFLNVEVYNNPNKVHQPITASPGIGNTYYNQASSNQYRGDAGQVSIEYGSRRPLTPTATPVGFTTGPLENFKTTVFEAAKIPVTISSVQPVIDTGYKTVVSPTVIPVTLTVDQFGTKTRGGSAASHGQSNVGIGTSYQQSEYGNRKDYISVTSSPALPAVSYQQPEIYVQSTTPASSGFSYGTVKPSYGEVVAPSAGPGSDKTQTQYLPPSSISPGIGVTYRKPFAVAGITYQQSTPQPDILKNQGFTGSSDSSFNSFYSKSDYSSNAKTTIESGSHRGGSPTNLDISRDQVGKLITNYDRGSVKYTPSLYDTYGGADISDRTLISNTDFSSKHLSQSSEYSGYTSSTPGLYGNTPPPETVTTYSGTYSRPTSKTASYEVTTKPSTAVGKAKVIVKWSDLHPLLLGKLGAECTCRADPFGNLRGPGSKVVSSSRGQVDLANYDESEIYVDLEKEGSYEDGDYVTNYGSVPRGPIKVFNTQAPIIVSDSKPLDDGSQFGNKPSTSYLPSIVPSTAGPVTTPCSNGRDYQLRGSVSGPTKIGSVPANTYIPSEQGLVSGQRTGKTLNSGEASVSASVGKAGAAFDRYGPGGLRGVDETLEGGADCARPGLFRHPNFCNKFYACHWDEWKKRFTLHVFNCPVHLTFDNSAGACNWPSKGPACQDDNLLV